MNIFSLGPDHNDKLVKIAEQLGNDVCVFAFDDDFDDVGDMEVGDIFQNRDDEKLYKVADIENDADEDQLIVQAENDFVIRADEFSVLMDKVAAMKDAEKRHRAGDTVIFHTLKQVAPEYAHGVDMFEGTGKWYS